MCRYCHIEGNNPFAIEHLTMDCQDSRNPYTIKGPTHKPQQYEGRVTQILKQQMLNQRASSQPMFGIGLSPYGPVPVVIGPQPAGFIPVMTSPGNFSYMPVFR